MSAAWAHKSVPLLAGGTPSGTKDACLSDYGLLYGGERHYDYDCADEQHHWSQTHVPSPYSTVTACYCYARMTNLATSYNWVSSVLLSLGDQSHPVCVAVARAIFVNVLLQLLLAACTLFVNALLVWVIAQLTVFELHVSADVEASQLMIRVFVSHS